ncbi:MAG: hypothetical protein JW849_07070, partial [Phycisphaerae bacterium]|nr:hypothetical protein [Phycisphaerae bacterium]
FASLTPGQMLSVPSGQGKIQQNFGETPFMFLLPEFLDGLKYSRNSFLFVLFVFSCRFLFPGRCSSPFPSA